MQYLMTCCFASFFALTSFRSAQPFTVKGKILDAKSGSPIAGATIEIKGEKKGTSSANDGSFSILVETENTHLIIFSVGYATQNIKAKNDNKELIIRLNAAETKLEEVVVTGYAPTRKKDLLAGVNTETNSFKPFGGLKISPVTSYSKDLGIQNISGFTPNNHDFNTEQYDEIVENRFLTATENPLSTF